MVSNFYFRSRCWPLRIEVCSGCYGNVIVHEILPPLVEELFMDKCEMEGQSLERVIGWLSSIFPNCETYHVSWDQHRDLLFEVLLKHLS